MIAIPLSKGLASAVFALISLLSIPWLIIERQSLITVVRRNIGGVALALPFLAYMISLFYSSDLAAGIKMINREMALILLPLITIIHQKFILGNLKKLVTLFIVTVTFNALITSILYLLPESASIAFSEFPLSQWIGVKEYEQLSKRESFGIYSPFMIRIQLSNLIAIGILFGLWLIANKHRVWLIAGCILMMLIGTTILGGRGGQLGLLGAIGIWILGWYFIRLHQTVKSRFTAIGSYTLIGAILIGVLFIAPYVAYQKVPAVKERYNQLMWEMRLYRNGEYKQLDYVHFTSLRRIISYQNSWKLIQSSPVLGVGVGDYNKEFASIYQKNHPEFPPNSHSHILFLWANAGIVGVLAWGVGLILWLSALFKNGRKWDLVLGISLFLFYFLIWLSEAMINQVDLCTYGLFMTIVYLLTKSLDDSSM